MRMKLKAHERMFAGDECCIGQAHVESLELNGAALVCRSIHKFHCFIAHAVPQVDLPVRIANEREQIEDGGIVVITRVGATPRESNLGDSGEMYSNRIKPRWLLLKSMPFSVAAIRTCSEQVEALMW